MVSKGRPPVCKLGDHVDSIKEGNLLFLFFLDSDNLAIVVSRCHLGSGSCVVSVVERLLVIFVVSIDRLVVVVIDVRVAANVGRTVCGLVRVVVVLHFCYGLSGVFGAVGRFDRGIQRVVSLVQL